MITRNGYVRQSAGGFRDEEGKKDFAFENENPNSGGDGFHASHVI